MLERNLFNADHEAFRDSFRRFMDKEIAPYHAAWEDQGYVDREVWRKAGANGFLCMTMPEQYGGAGVDKLYSVVQMEELSGGGFSGIGYGLHTEIVAPYILHYGTEAQKQKYLPRLATGELVGAIAMSEPAADSASICSIEYSLSTPAPPYSSGMVMHRKPLAPALFQTSRST